MEKEGVKPSAYSKNGIKKPLSLRGEGLGRGK